VTGSVPDRDVPTWKRVQKGFREHGLKHVFVEHLGWGAGNSAIHPIHSDGDVINPVIVAEVKGYTVFLIEMSPLPAPKSQAQIDKELGIQAPERITIFTDGITHQWRWPHQTPSGGVSFETLSVSATSMPSFLAQRLVGLRFSAKDFAGGLSLLDVRDRVRGKFDGEKVTKKFFDEFKRQHSALASSVEGLELEDDRATYATLIMNRLMLLYFLQKREFLNDDAFYLENCLAEIQKLRGVDSFYSFYRDILLPMFFERLSSFPPGDVEPEVSSILGDIPYINGGIYEPSSLESKLGDQLNVPDSTFSAIFDFFGRFNWHLDTRPSGSENEINPEVIGYIFEQYINFTAGGKKANGAYYTKEDVTGYMVGATVIPRILDFCDELGIIFTDLLAAEPLRYIPTDLLHGLNSETSTWLPMPHALQALWDGDPIGWGELDKAETDDALCLPGENWVEAFYRRERIDRLRLDLSDGLVSGVNDLVTNNLNARLVLLDAIDRVDDPTVASQIWSRVSSMTIIDPTVGSGAFLFAAMEALEDVYHHIIEVLKGAQSRSPAIDAVVDEIKRHPNDRYFTRKTIALNNLFGTDLMPDAIETAQLRIFLALVSCLEHRSELEPLPNLDFNLKTGNLLLGLKDQEDLARLGGDVLAQLALADLRPKIEEYKAVYSQFVTDSGQGQDGESRQLRDRLSELSDELRAETNKAFSDIEGIEPAAQAAWIEKYRPFHWFIEFPAVIEGGGFDVVLGNPPYVARKNLSPEEKRQVTSYATAEAPDLYAMCLERSSEISRKVGGRYAFIVMLSLSAGNRFEVTRVFLNARFNHRWWSTFGSRPATLFSGVMVKNTILVCANDETTGSEQVTKHNVFTTLGRQSLFQGLEYHPSQRAPGAILVRGGLATPLLDALASLNFVKGSPTNHKVYFRVTGRFWFPALLKRPPVLDGHGAILHPVDQRMGTLEIGASESRLIVFAVMAGKIGFLNWSATGDDFHMLAHAADTPRNIQSALADFRHGELLANDIWERGKKLAFVSTNNDGYINIRWNAARDGTDIFDRWILEETGLKQHWRPLNIWYRQTMRSGSPNNNSRYLTDEESERFLGSENGVLPS
jgi:hypothetical protein